MIYKKSTIEVLHFMKKGDVHEKQINKSGDISYDNHYADYHNDNKRLCAR